MTQTVDDRTVLVAHDDLLTFVTAVFTGRGVPVHRAHRAADALCYGDLTGMTSHGVVNLTRLYLPLFADGRVVAGSEPRIVSDCGAAVLMDADRALGLSVAGEAMDLAADRAAILGVGLVSVRGLTHVGCAGRHARRAAERGMVGILASNCGRQRIVRPPGGAVPMLGTNPLSVAAPAVGRHPFVLDMSTSVVPTGRIRAAQRAGHSIPAGWLCTDGGQPVTDPGAFDRGEAHLQWLGGGAQTGGFKGFGLGLAVEILAALVSGSGRGPDAAAVAGDRGRDDDIGLLAVAIAPDALRDPAAVAADATALFDSLIDCPPAGTDPVRYPGWLEGERAAYRRAGGVPMPAGLVDELDEVARAEGVRPVVR
ncbi:MULTISPECIES: Ldh family oxidoreductase [Actinoplanes]|uniref:Ldh family oxidoreductase n=1 Tax=Actinoplanes TaxID=1865 RepID=UPI0005F28A56|nr:MULTISPECIES: Ldh family oxidoreductase [Actinoplanes]GLY05390.1 malate dehydrogenase [Actinoplanes sp. NBRC 101535]